MISVGDRVFALLFSDIDYWKEAATMYLQAVPRLCNSQYNLLSTIAGERPKNSSSKEPCRRREYPGLVQSQQNV